MIWTPRRRHAQERAQAQAQAALEESRADLASTRAQGQEVRRVASRLRSIQQENHFAETLRAIYGGRQ